MGIGRFAFTPALPLMQAADGLTLVQGGWLASSNYAGYLLGALLCIWLPARPAFWARAGLLLVALTTLAMTFSDHFLLWLLWRLLAGLASAFVLVGLSAWCLGRLVQLGQPRLAGLIYAGVGVGLAFAGTVGMVAGVAQVSPASFWCLLGWVAFAVWLLCRWGLKTELPPATQTAVVNRGFTLDAWRLIGCYGIFGIGYILPATFLPAMARAQFADPALFGWVWPLFGLAAAVSTLLVASFAGRFAPRRVWALAALIMAVGVALPVLSQGMISLLLAALCVGGTFMVMTMAGMQEARASGGAKLIAAMTASFAAGQLLGPLLVSLAQGQLFWPSLMGAGLLLLSALLLVVKPPQTAIK